MGKLGFLFTAYSVVWVALFIYLVSLAKKITFLSKEVDILKQKAEKSE
jgi:CcmD family protein